MRKSLKKLCCVGAAVLLVFGLSACSPKEDNAASQKGNITDNAENKKDETSKKNIKTGPYEKGTVEGNHFESVWLNMQADFSDEYTILSEEEVDKLQAQGSAINGSSQEEDAEELEAIKNEMMVMSLEGIPYCAMVIQKLPTENISDKEYLEIIGPSMAKSMSGQFEVEIKEETPTVIIAEEEYTCLQLVMYMDDIEMNSNVYVQMRDNYAITLNVVFDPSTEQQKDELLAAFQPMEAR